MLDEPLEPEEARSLARKLFSEGRVRYTGHALDEMEKDGLVQHDVERALHGICEPAEWTKQQWRYRFHAYDVWVVIAFRDGEIIVIITAWRKRS